MPTRHLTNPLNVEYTLCGIAYEGDVWGEKGEPPVFVNPGKRTNCPQCRVVVNYCRSLDGYAEPLPIRPTRAAQRR